MKLLLIGWDAADWKIIHPLVDQGKMPHLKSLIQRGTIGNLATMYPELSPMLWTSIATGKRPHKHGIHGFAEPNREGDGIQPISNLQRKTKAIWNILHQNKKKSNVVGWWPSHPVEPIDGVMVSNHFHKVMAPHGEPWPMRPGTIHPKRLEENLKSLRVHPQDLDSGLMKLFLPHLEEMKDDPRIETVAKISAECATMVQTTCALMKNEPWDFTAVYLDSVDHYCHAFMNFHPPRLKGISERDFEWFKNVVESGYRYHDVLLGSLLEQAGEDCHVMIVSDHGFHSDHLRPLVIPEVPAGPAVSHRHYGVFLVAGPNIRQDERIYGASLIDSCPTMLSLLGLPVGQDMDGKVLLNIYEKAPEVTSVPSWDEVPGDAGTHPEDMTLSFKESQEAVDQLVELGYIDKPDANVEKAVEDTQLELDFNLARSYVDANLPLEAIGILKRLTHEHPDDYRLTIQLIYCYLAVTQVKEARQLMGKMVDLKKEKSKLALEDLEKFKEEVAGIKANEWSERQRSQFKKLDRASGWDSYALELILGILDYAESYYESSLEHFFEAEKFNPGKPELQIKMGDSYLKLREYDLAKARFEKSLSFDPENAQAEFGLARVFYSCLLFEDCSEACLNSIGLLFFNPEAHFLLGTALRKLGKNREARAALEMAVQQNPNEYRAYTQLAYLMERKFSDPEKAKAYRVLAKKTRLRTREIKSGDLKPLVKKLVMPKSLELEEGGEANVEGVSVDSPVLERRRGRKKLYEPSKDIVVVTGLPRSGTSMMMQMLSAGGLDILTEGQRVPDLNNPKGYYEYEKVKGLRKNSKWLLDESKGKCLKVISHLLTSLPREGPSSYWVVFMVRDLSEILKSQKVMLGEGGALGSASKDLSLSRSFSQQIILAKRFLAKRSIPTLFIDYAGTVAHPQVVAEQLKGFFSGALDIKKMSEQIDPSLYRQKQ